MSDATTELPEYLADGYEALEALAANELSGHEARHEAKVKVEQCLDELEDRMLAERERREVPTSTGPGGSSEHVPT